ncbi:unnamed protein product [Owenia fusiformis]|uniref:Tyrosinase copper-binding domain-containing protein n=1 Tax=Owenia fusiformis TaxID=6347 RepID=A0A8S4Q8E6_OWEFU|nr:unnamed protein product [Owenia fusiformis]
MSLWIIHVYFAYVISCCNVVKCDSVFSVCYNDCRESGREYKICTEQCTITKDEMAYTPCYADCRTVGMSYFVCKAQCIVEMDNEIYEQCYFDCGLTGRGHVMCLKDCTFNGNNGVNLKCYDDCTGAGGNYGTCVVECKMTEMGNLFDRCYDDCRNTGEDRKLCVTKCLVHQGDSVFELCYVDCRRNGSSFETCQKECFVDEGIMVYGPCYNDCYDVTGEGHAGCLSECSISEGDMYTLCYEDCMKVPNTAYPTCMRECSIREVDKVYTPCYEACKATGENPGICKRMCTAIDEASVNEICYNDCIKDGQTAVQCVEECKVDKEDSVYDKCSVGCSDTGRSYGQCIDVCTVQFGGKVFDGCYDDCISSGNSAAGNCVSMCSVAKNSYIFGPCYKDCRTIGGTLCYCMSTCIVSNLGRVFPACYSDCRRRRRDTDDCVVRCTVPKNKKVYLSCYEDCRRTGGTHDVCNKECFYETGDALYKTGYKDCVDECVGESCKNRTNCRLQTTISNGASVYKPCYIACRELGKTAFTSINKCLVPEYAVVNDRGYGDCLADNGNQRKFAHICLEKSTLEFGGSVYGNCYEDNRKLGFSSFESIAKCRLRFRGFINNLDYAQCMLDEGTTTGPIDLPEVCANKTTDDREPSDRFDPATGEEIELPELQDAKDICSKPHSYTECGINNICYDMCRDSGLDHRACYSACDPNEGGLNLFLPCFLKLCKEIKDGDAFMKCKDQCRPESLVSIECFTKCRKLGEDVGYCTNACQMGTGISIHDSCFDSCTKNKNNIEECKQHCQIARDNHVVNECWKDCHRIQQDIPGETQCTSECALTLGAELFSPCYVDCIRDGEPYSRCFQRCTIPNGSDGYRPCYENCMDGEEMLPHGCLRQCTLNEGGMYTLCYTQCIKDDGTYLDCKNKCFIAEGFEVYTECFEDCTESGEDYFHCKDTCIIDSKDDIVDPCYHDCKNTTNGNYELCRKTCTIQEAGRLEKYETCYQGCPPTSKYDECINTCKRTVNEDANVFALCYEDCKNYEPGDVSKCKDICSAPDDSLLFPHCYVDCSRLVDHVGGFNNECATKCQHKEDVGYHVSCYKRCRNNSRDYEQCISECKISSNVCDYKRGYDDCVDECVGPKCSIDRTPCREQTAIPRGMNVHCECYVACRALGKSAVISIEKCLIPMYGEVYDQGYRDCMADQAQLEEHAEDCLYLTTLRNGGTVFAPCYEDQRQRGDSASSSITKCTVPFGFSVDVPGYQKCIVSSFGEACLVNNTKERSKIGGGLDIPSKPYTECRKPVSRDEVPLFCGFGPIREDCPKGTTCDVLPNDMGGLCCPKDIQCDEKNSTIYSRRDCKNDYESLKRQRAYQGLSIQQYVAWCDHVINWRTTASSGGRFGLSVNQRKWIKTILDKMQMLADTPTTTTITDMIQKRSVDKAQGRSKRFILTPWFRKEYRSASQDERDAFHRAINRLKADKIDEWNNKYDTLVTLHDANLAHNAHGGAASLPWNRVYLLIFELALREYDNVTLLYWDSTLEQGLTEPASSSLWSRYYLGNANGPVTTGPFANWSTTDLRKLTRDVNKCFNQLPTADDMNAIFRRRFYREIACGEGAECMLVEQISGKVHSYVGGHMSDINNAPNDPIFWMHRAFIDYIWEEFREKIQDNPTTDYPTSYGPSAHQPQALMQPFSSLGLNIRNIQGLSAVFTLIFYRYESTPKCPDCGDSAILYCDTETNRCKPFTMESKKQQCDDHCAFVNAKIYCEKRYDTLYGVSGVVLETLGIDYEGRKSESYFGEYEAYYSGKETLYSTASDTPIYNGYFPVKQPTRKGERHSFTTSARTLDGRQCTVECFKGYTRKVKRKGIPIYGKCPKSQSIVFSTKPTIKGKNQDGSKYTYAIPYVRDYQSLFYSPKDVIRKPKKPKMPEYYRVTCPCDIQEYEFCPNFIPNQK